VANKCELENIVLYEYCLIYIFFFSFLITTLKEPVNTHFHQNRNRGNVIFTKIFLERLLTCLFHLTFVDFIFSRKF